MGVSAVGHQGRAGVGRIQGDAVVAVAAGEVVGDGHIAAGRAVGVVDVDPVAEGVIDPAVLDQDADARAPGQHGVARPHVVEGPALVDGAAVGQDGVEAREGVGLGGVDAQVLERGPMGQEEEAVGPGRGGVHHRAVPGPRPFHQHVRRVEHAAGTIVGARGNPHRFARALGGAQAVVDVAGVVEGGVVGLGPVAGDGQAVGGRGQGRGRGLQVDAVDVIKVGRIGRVHLEHQGVAGRNRRAVEEDARLVPENVGGAGRGALAHAVVGAGRFVDPGLGGAHGNSLVEDPIHVKVERGGGAPAGGRVGDAIADVHGGDIQTGVVGPLHILARRGQLNISVARGFQGRAGKFSGRGDAESDHRGAAANRSRFRFVSDKGRVGARAGNRGDTACGGRGRTRSPSQERQEQRNVLNFLPLITLSTVHQKMSS